MASIIVGQQVEAPAESCWDAVRDFAAPHERLSPGFIVDLEMTGPRERRISKLLTLPERLRQHHRLVDQALELVALSLPTLECGPVSCLPIVASAGAQSFRADIWPNASARLGQFIGAPGRCHGHHRTVAWSGWATNGPHPVRTPPAMRRNPRWRLQRRTARTFRCCSRRPRVSWLRNAWSATAPSRGSFAPTGPLQTPPSGKAKPAPARAVHDGALFASVGPPVSCVARRCRRDGWDVGLRRPNDNRQRW